MTDDRIPDDDHAQPRDRLLAAVIACIEKHGISTLTSRLIAAEAGVNPAAINYYFGSKDNLVEQALELTRKQGFVDPLLDFDRLVEAGATPTVALRGIIRQMLSDGMSYPKIGFAHLRDAIENQRYDGTAVLQLNDFLTKLERRLEPLGSAERRRARRARLAQMWMTLGMTIMAPDLLRDFTRLDLRRKGDQELFVDQLMASLQGSGVR